MFWESDEVLFLTDELLFWYAIVVFTKLFSNDFLKIANILCMIDDS